MTFSSQLLCNPASVTAARAPSMWNHSKGKRLFDLLLSTIFLILLSPLLLVIGAFVKLTSKGPILYRHRRVGMDGHEFQVTKFRTMQERQTGPNVTCAGDPRITAVGRVLRRWKLDELPQLLNVLRGEMSFVGPRPDVSEYLASLNAEQREILCLRPGITGRATLHYRNEEQLLSKVPDSELKNFYCTHILPDKVYLDLNYARSASFVSDITILFQTVKAILTPSSSAPEL
jgi:lipopolysaccharide/colanic/teichoic acid biosynthesis glycosyltransferase